MFLKVSVLVCGLNVAGRTGQIAGGKESCERSMNHQHITDVHGLVEGMTRKEVQEVLGNKFYSHAPLSWRPVIDSFPYLDEKGHLKFNWIFYSDGHLAGDYDDRESVYNVN